MARDQGFVDERSAIRGFLAEASEALDATLDARTTALTAVRLAVTRVADGCDLYLVAGDGRLHRAATARSGSEAAIVEGGPASSDPPEVVARAVAECRAERGSTRLALPLVARGRTVGALLLEAPTDNRSAASSGLAADFARRVALAIDNARLYAEAQQAIRSRDELLATVSHDLRNPIGAILLNAKALVRKLPSKLTPEDRAVEQAAMIVRAAERLGRMIADLLDEASISAGRLVLARQPTDFAAVVNDAVELLRPLAQERLQQVDVDASPAPAVALDRDRILRTMTNLVGNAIRFSPEGGRIAVRSGERDGELLVSVADTGPGIPAEHAKHVFDRWWRGDGSAYADRGTGLGLYIARGFVEAHGGRIWVESHQGAGSTFHFTLPFSSKGDHRVG